MPARSFCVTQRLTCSHESDPALHHLPAISDDINLARLPLVDHTLLQLANAVLCDDPAAGVELLEGALLNDPALALWCVAFAWKCHEREIDTIDDAACWLQQDGIDQLSDGADNVDDGDVEQWLPFVRKSLALRRSAAPESSLVSMLSNAAEWASALGTAKLELPPSVTKQSAATDSSTDDSTGDIDQLVAAWQAEHPLAASLFRRAVAMRARVEAFESRWDEDFLREKLASLKEFTYGASHELNNPLFNISSRAQMLLRDEEDPDRRRKLSTIYAHAMRASEMINDIALAARPPKPNCEEVDVAAVAREMIVELQPSAEEQATSLTLTDDTSIRIEADATQLAVAVREIIINALESLKRSTRRGEVAVTLAAEDDDHVSITVTDNGPGLDARAKRHLFDPYFSGYESGRGLGFGLTKCWQIVQAHGGTIVVDSQPQQGTTVTMRLPFNQTPTETSSPNNINADSGS